MDKLIDIGCGSNKTDGAFGVDIFPYDGVDSVFDLDEAPWPIENDSFDRAVCRHVIEHVRCPILLMKEVFRILRPGGILEVATPHFSFIHSWSDPTHMRHLSTQWYTPFQKGGYLAEQIGAFQLVSTTVEFGSSIRSWIPRLMVKLLGVNHWEKHYAFVYPAQNVITVLKTIK
ncbi:MAG: class I SAM-dependent methyltransferase [Planctomycetes bacterium]|nr:class I SAM-dependent methyltransferase [Planctomycetota bacterium]